MIFGSILKVVASFAVLFTSLTSGTPLVGSANKDLVANQQTNSQGRPVRVIHQFPNNTWLENLAVRSNGQILVTVLTSPDLYLIDPTNSRPVLVHHFANHLSLFGIAELGHDIFYVIAGNYSQPTNTNTPGSYDVYRVDFSKQPAHVRLTAHFPKAMLLNGMATLNAATGLLLIGDAGAGVVYRLNVNTGATAVVIDDPTMKPPAGAPVGIDGVQIRNNVLYFTNAPIGNFVRIPLRADGTAAGPAVIQAQNIEADDFTFDTAGNAYLALTYSKEIVKLPPGASTSTVIAGPSDALNGPTACKFGRRKTDSKMLYVTTNGGLGVADGSSTPGGTLSRVNVGKSSS